MSSTEVLRQTIAEQGWASAPFEMLEADRAEYARLGNRLIDCALEDKRVADALTFNTMPELDAGHRLPPGLFTVSTAVNSKDQKIWLHAGTQSKMRVEDNIPERNQPPEMRSFWVAHETMLDEVETSIQWVLGNLGATALAREILPPDRNLWTIHLRTVRYQNALSMGEGTEIVSGHADQDVCSEHIFETHGGWFQIAPYPAELLIDEDTPERRQGIDELRKTLRPLEIDLNNNAAFFFGASWPAIPSDLRSVNNDSEIPAGYHAGFRPADSDQSVSEFAEMVAGNSHDRVSVVANWALV